MHIVIFIQRYLAGGAEKQASYLSKFLLKEGYKVTIIGFGNIMSPASKWFAGIPCVALGFTEKNIFSENNQLLSKLRASYDLWRLKSQLKKLKPDVLMPFTYQPNILSGLLWRRVGAKACVWNQRDEGRYFRDSVRDLKALMACSAYVANSRSGKNFLESKGIINVSYIPNMAVIKELNIIPNSKELKAAMVGNLHMYKDHKTLLKAWAIVVEMLKKEEIVMPILYLIGANGNAKNEIEALILHLNLQNYVILTGQIEYPEGLLKNCTLSVFSSNNEGLPNAVLEAMAIGLPVVVTRIPGTEEALGSDYPYLIPQNNEREFAQAILKLYRNPHEQEEISQRNKARIKNHFSSKAVGFEYKRLLEEIFQRISE